MKVLGESTTEYMTIEKDKEMIEWTKIEEIVLTERVIEVVEQAIEETTHHMKTDDTTQMGKDDRNGLETKVNKRKKTTIIR